MKTYKTPIMKPVELKSSAILAGSPQPTNLRFTPPTNEQEGTQGFETEYAFE